MTHCIQRRILGILKEDYVFDSALKGPKRTGQLQQFYMYKLILKLI